MAVKSLTSVLELTKYNEVDMPESLNVLSSDMQILDDYAGEVNYWREVTDATLVELREDIDRLNPQSIAALENKVNTNATNIANLNSDVVNLRNRETTSEQRLTAIESEQTVQNGRLDTIDAEQLVQNNNISALGDDITSLSSHVTSYETATDARLDTIEQDIENLKTEDETITAQLLSDATELADHENRITALEQTGLPAPVVARIEALETDVGVLNTTVAGQQTTLDAVEGTIQTMQTDIGGVQTDVSTLTTSYDALLARVVALENLLVAGVNTTSGLGIYAAEDPQNP